MPQFNLFSSGLWRTNFVGGISQGIGRDLNKDHIDITIDLPEDTSPEQLQEIVRQAALKADALHRSNGGNGLKIDLVEIFEESRVPEGSIK